MTHRPEIHLLPENGILQGPAGVLRDGQRWHVFYQYKPSADSPARWGHSYAEDDPFYWLECDDVLAPAGGEVELRSGAVAPTTGGAHLYFTSVTNNSTSINLARFADISDECEVSEDPLALDPNVARIGTVVEETQGFRRFRSPCVVPDWASANGNDDREAAHEGWLMLALTGSSEEPQPVILRSPDGQNWDFSGALDFVGDPEFPTPDGLLPPVVAPRIVRLRDEVSEEIFDVLFLTLEATGSAGSEIAGYLVGRLKGTQFHVTTGFRRLDYGHDFTRPRNTNFSSGTQFAGDDYSEAVIIGLLNGRGRADNPAQHHSWQEEGWANVLTLPRKLTLQDGVIFQTPPRHLTRAVEDSDHARMWTGLLNVPEGSSLTLTLLDGDGDPAATICHSGSRLTVDRSATKAFGGTYRDDAPATAPLAEGEEDTLTVVVDGSTIEVYADSGLVTMSSRMYFEGGCSGIQVDTTGDTEVIRSFEVTGS